MKRLLDRNRLAARLKQLPSLPPLVVGLLASFDNDEVDVGKIARQIALDQGLTACVLRVANSSFYGLQRKVGTINDALVVLGFRTVRSMVLAVSINGAFRADHCPGFEPQAYRRHCVGVGIGARALAMLTRHNADLAFTAGILHDIGQLVLAANFPEEYAATFVYRSQHDCFLVDAERDVLGLDHGEVGGMLAEAWHFPPALQEALAEHHAPAAAPAGSLANLVHVADAIAHALGLAQAPDEMLMPPERIAWQRLEVNREKLRLILPQIAADMDDACRAFNA